MSASFETPLIQVDLSNTETAQPNFLRGFTATCKQALGRTVVAFGLATGMITGETIALEPPAATADTGGYPNTDAVERDISTFTWWVDENNSGAFNNGEEWSPRGYGYRNCTDWVAWRVPGLGVGGVPGGLGNGAAWDNNAPGAWAKDILPEPGDIAQSEAGTFGHVGVVESYTKNTAGAVTSITVSEYNKAGTGLYSIKEYAPDGNGVFWRSSGKKWDKFLDLNGTGKGINGEDITGGGTTTPTAPTPDPIPALVQRPNGETGLVVVAPDKTLDYHFNAPGSEIWHRLDIPAGDAKSTPAAVLRQNGELNIAAQGDDGSLDFYINPPGTNTWHKIEIAGNGSIESAPSMVQRPDGETNIVVQGPNNSLDFYYNAQGSPSWGKVTVPNGQAHSKPAIVQRSSGETNIAVLGSGNSMDFYYNAQGSPSWGKLPVAVGGWALSAPSMIQRPTGETVIAVQGPNHSLDAYINTPGSPAWGRIRAAGDGTTYNDTNPPAMLLRPSGELDITVHGPGNQADFYYNQQDSPDWGRTLVAIGGYAFREPVMIQRPMTGETDMIIIGPDKRLEFYMNTPGSPPWGVLPISGNNSAY